MPNFCIRSQKKQIKINIFGTVFSTPNVIIAGGVGSFEPRKFPVKDCEKFENKSIFYSIKDKKIFNGKTISIFGGGDLRLIPIELSKTAKVNLIHRRDGFSEAISAETKRQLKRKENKFITKFQMDSVSEDNQKVQ